MLAGIATQKKKKKYFEVAAFLCRQFLTFKVITECLTYQLIRGYLHCL